MESKGNSDTYKVLFLNEIKIDKSTGNSFLYKYYIGMIDHAFPSKRVSHVLTVIALCEFVTTIYQDLYCDH